MSKCYYPYFYSWGNEIQRHMISELQSGDLNWLAPRNICIKRLKIIAIGGNQTQRGEMTKLQSAS